MNILITGGAGFIGTNCAVSFAGQGHDVVVFDNLSRAGSEKNIQWIQDKCSAVFEQGDLRDSRALVGVVTEKGPFDLILHLGAQVAVTSSVNDPREDFEINALGTFNLLEAVRQYNPRAVLIYASTNKVYGEMKDLDIQEEENRYVYRNLSGGVDEGRNLDFHSPYGCSKGAADQYCCDYARIYGLKTVVMRQSCIYGYRQFGIEDQGWVAWFCIAAAQGEQITIYGDGKQVRDVLFIDDLVGLYELAFSNAEQVSGKVFNIGGGPSNTLSLHELIAQLEALSPRNIPLRYEDWRPGDQRIYVSNICLAEKTLGWRPIIKPSQGVEKLYNWVTENEHLFA
jgi:CDP-paratose 2-epimerase